MSRGGRGWALADAPYSKLPGVLHCGVEVLRCPKCGESEVVIPKPNQLGDLLARHLIEKHDRLFGPEVRFLWAHLNGSGAELARQMGVAPETVSMWENGKNTMGPSLTGFCACWWPATRPPRPSRRLLSLAVARRYRAGEPCAAPCGGAVLTAS